MGASGSKKQFYPLIIPDVQVKLSPELEKFRSVFNLGIQRTADVAAFAIASKSVVAKINGKAKTDPSAFSAVYKLYVDKAIKPQPKIPVGYNYFGDGSCDQILRTVLKTNPFYASAIQPNGANGFKVVSTAASNNWFSKVCAQVDPMYFRVDITFNTLDGPIEYRRAGQLVTGDDIQNAAGQLLLLLSYYAEVTHALIHVFHFVMVGGMFVATSASDAQQDWANTYVPSVAETYREVETLLFTPDTGALTGGMVKVTNYDNMMNLVRSMLCLWGSFNNTDDFVNKFLLCSLTPAQANTLGLLVDFKAQAALIPGFADELTVALGNTSGVNKSLKAYTDAATPASPAGLQTVFTYTNASPTNWWIHLMSVTGILHGATLSMTRVMCTSQVWRWIQPTNPNFNNTDVSNLSTLILTMVGREKGKYVFSPLLLESRKHTKKVKNVLGAYSAQSNDLKAAYQTNLLTDPRLLNLGWLLSDYCTDGFDNKQLTLDTYF